MPLNLAPLATGTCIPKKRPNTHSDTTLYHLPINNELAKNDLIDTIWFPMVQDFTRSAALAIMQRYQLSLLKNPYNQRILQFL